MNKDNLNKKSTLSENKIIFISLIFNFSIYVLFVYIFYLTLKFCLSYFLGADNTNVDIDLYNNIALFIVILLAFLNVRNLYVETVNNAKNLYKKIKE